MLQMSVDAIIIAKSPARTVSHATTSPKRRGAFTPNHRDEHAHRKKGDQKCHLSFSRVIET